MVLSIHQKEILNFGCEGWYQWAINAQMTGRVTYYLNQHWGISTGIQVQKNLSNWSTEQAVQMRPGIWLWETGVTYRW